MKKEKVLNIYLVVLAIAIIIAGISPVNRTVWFLDSFLIYVVAITLVSIRKKFQFSLTSYTLIFIFLLIGTAGAHYTYEDVPLNFIMNTFHLERNPDDRIAHFSFGLLLYFPLLELFVKTTKLKHKFWMYFVPLFVIAGLGAIYEVAEWIVAISIDPQNAQAFLGMQGDIWDAQKDMLLNTLGGITSMIICIIKKVSTSGNLKPY